MAAAKLMSRVALLAFLILVGSSDSVGLWNQATQAQVCVGDYCGCEGLGLYGDSCGCGVLGDRMYWISWNNCTGEYSVGPEFCEPRWECNPTPLPSTTIPPMPTGEGCVARYGVCDPSGQSSLQCCSGLSCLSDNTVGNYCG